MVAIGIVIAVHNAAPYLPRLLKSLQAQTFADFVAVFVDDASTDASVEILEGWGDARFRVIRLAEQKGNGPARNLGLDTVIGELHAETVCIADADDVLPPHSLAVRYAAYRRTGAAVRACHVEMSADGRILSRTPVPPGIPPVCVPHEQAYTCSPAHFLFFHWAWLVPAIIIRREGVRYPEGFCVNEDVAFFARLFFHLHRVAFIPDVVYHWVRHSGSVSTTPYSTTHFFHTIDALAVFCAEAHKHNHAGLACLQCDNVLGTHLPNLAARLAEGGLTEEEGQAVLDYFQALCKQYAIFTQTLQKGLFFAKPQWGIAALWHALEGQGSVRQRLANAFAWVEQAKRDHVLETTRQQGWLRDITFDKFDATKRLLRGRYLFCNTPPQEQWLYGEVALKSAYAKNRAMHRGEDHTIFQRILWLPVPQANEKTGERLVLRLGEHDIGLSITVPELEQGFAPVPLAEKVFSPDIARFRALALSSPVQQKYRGAWLCMDHPAEAGGNAEALYHWLTQGNATNTPPKEKVFFVLHTASPDWGRLARAGAQLVAFGSEDHALLHLLAGHVVSSQPEALRWFALPPSFFDDMRHCCFVCLPAFLPQFHTAFKQNNFDADCVATGTEAERAILVADNEPYSLTGNEVVHTGQPRHDFLRRVALRAEAGAGQAEKNILFLPEFQYPKMLEREYAFTAGSAELFAEPIAGGYVSDEDAEWWQTLLGMNTLCDLCLAHGYKVIFRPPATSQRAMPTRRHDAVTVSHAPYLDLLARASLLVTGSASHVFDMASLQRPSLYMPPRKHVRAEVGPFSHMQGGAALYPEFYCPVVTGYEDLLLRLKTLVETNCRMDEEHCRRAREAFARNDGKSCQRIMQAIQGRHD